MCEKAMGEEAPSEMKRHWPKSTIIHGIIVAPTLHPWEGTVQLLVPNLEETQSVIMVGHERADHCNWSLHYENTWFCIITHAPHMNFHLHYKEIISIVGRNIRISIKDVHILPTKN